jgi:hypothetical protein
MKTIEEHTKEILRVRGDHHKTGVECPSCKEELQYKEPGVFLMSSPPQAHVLCFGCGYRNTIYV